MNSEQDFYFTVKSAYRAPELKVKSSRFIADIFLAASKAVIEKQLSEIRKEFYDATHHCYAYRLGIQADQIRSADDGEPAGTAGKPILQALVSKELTNCLLIVTRYYGGVNLGTGGLSKAYGEAAQSAVKGATIKTIYLTNTFILHLGYEEITMLEKLLLSFETKAYDAQYGEKIIMKADIRKSLSSKFKTDILEKFHGKVLLFED
jgi:uncharacterized YigZ family protein